MSMVKASLEDIFMELTADEKNDKAVKSKKNNEISMDDAITELDELTKTTDTEQEEHNA